MADTPNFSFNELTLLAKYGEILLELNENFLSIDSILGTTAGKNKLINGNFERWQKGTSQTDSGYNSDDRWFNSNTGSTKVHSQQSFTVGQTDVPNNPSFYSSTVVTSVANAGNFVKKSQRIENVSVLSGDKSTISFFAKADSTKNIAIEFSQSFGSGGSSNVSGIGAQKVALTTSWTKYEITIDIPSISGKTVGEDSNLEFNFWFDAGSTFDSRTDSLGQQSGTFDLSTIKIELGEIATPFNNDDFSILDTKTGRYFERIVRDISGKDFGIGTALSSTTLLVYIKLSHKKRTSSPDISFSGITDFNIRGGTINVASTNIIANVAMEDAMSVLATIGTTALTPGNCYMLRSGTTNVFIDINDEL